MAAPVKPHGLAVLCIVLAHPIALVVAQQPPNGPPQYPWAYVESQGVDVNFKRSITTAQRGQGSQMATYGDSILQCLRFDDMCRGSIAVGERRFGQYNPLHFAVGGERPASLMGRLLDGVVPTGLGKASDVAVVVMIGHNGLGDLNGGVQQTVDQVKDIIDYILRADARNQVIAIALLPATGGDFQYKKGQLYAPQVYFNKALATLADEQPRVHYADCISLFLNPNNTDMSNPELIPDGTHLSPEGFEVLADCLDPFLTAITSDLNPLTGPSAGLPDAPWQRRMAAMLAAPAPGPAGFASYDVRAPETAPKAAPAPDLSAATAAGGGARQVQTAPAPVTVDAFQPSLAVQVLPLGR